MNELNTVIDGYSVCLMLESETTQCYIEKGNASASLECALAHGTFSGEDDHIKIPKYITDKIEEWAVSHGY